MATSSVGGTDSTEGVLAGVTGGGGGTRSPTGTGSGGGGFDWLNRAIGAVGRLIGAALQLIYRLAVMLWNLFHKRPRGRVIASGFYRFQYHAAEAIAGDSAFALSLRALSQRAASFDDETAARLYLTQILSTDQPGQPVGLRAIPAGSDRLVDSLRFVDLGDLRENQTRLIRFQQTYASIPVFGSLALCELDEGKGLVSAKGTLVNIASSSSPSVGPVMALKKVERFTKTRLAKPVSEPKLTFLKAPQESDWHLTYHFTKIPAAPGGADGSWEQRPLPPLVDYFVDAHTGSVIYSFISDPMIDVPTRLKGFDDEGAQLTFDGRFHDPDYELLNPHLNISTRDLGFGDVVDCALGRVSLPDPVRSSTADLGGMHSAAVSAHANASKVFRFFTSVLNRQGVDGKGTELVNVVNCTYRRAGPPPTWPNAAWYYERMWYGQTRGPEDNLRSFARFIDVMTHELTHGVTSSTAKLVPDAESGALNESFSDIFAIIVKNWDWTKSEDGGDVSSWDWEIGSGLSASGGPLRDIKEPSRTGAPAHTSDRKGDPRDQSAVHDNSCIHSKAAYNLLTAVDENGQRMFSPYEVAIHYYYCLLQLSPQADFAEALQTLISVAQSRNRGNPDVMAKAVSAIRNAYSAVGITEIFPPVVDTSSSEPIVEPTEDPEQRRQAVVDAINELIESLNAVVEEINQVHNWLQQRDYNAADASLATSRQTLAQTEAPMKQLRMRQRGEAYQKIYRLATESRDIQGQLIALADAAIAQAKAGDWEAFDGSLTEHNELVIAYNQNIDVINKTIQSDLS